MNDLLQENINTRTCNIKFLKANGELREMRCTRNLDVIPKEFHPKADSKKTSNDDIIVVFDLEKNGWRSFNKYRLTEVVIND